MKYYLGYYQNEHYIPIKNPEIGDSILDIVNFTTRFSSINDIKKYLFEKDLIPYQDVYLNYIIEKGQKDNKYYTRLKNTDKVYTMESKTFFSIETLKEQLDEYSDDLDFLVFLYSEYIKKYGINNKISIYLQDLASTPEKLIIVVSELINAVNSEAAKGAVNTIISYYNDNKNNLNIEILANHALSFMNTIILDPADLSNTVICLKKYIDINKIPAFSHLSAWLKNALNQNRVGEIESSYDYLSISSECNAFFTNLVYDYDYKKGEYKKVNGKRKIRERNLFDLGVLLDKYNHSLYEAYIESLNQDNDKQQTNYSYIDENDYYEKEEFLEESDFERIGTTSEESGIKLRY